MRNYQVEVIPETEIRLDGGAIFGVVPRVVFGTCRPARRESVLLSRSDQIGNIISKYGLGISDKFARNHYLLEKRR